MKKSPDSPPPKKSTRPAPKAPAKRPRGRPSAFTPAVVQGLVDAIEGGSTLRQACNAEGMPSERSVQRRAEADEEFRRLLSRAREMRCQSYEDRLLEIGNDALMMALKLLGSTGGSAAVQSYSIKAQNLRYLISLDRAPAVATEPEVPRLNPALEAAVRRIWPSEPAEPAMNQATQP